MINGAQQQQASQKDLRSFGLVVGGVFGIIAVLPMILHRQSPRPMPLILATVLIALGATFPSLLKWPHRLWMMIGTILGWINTRIILSLLYFGLFTPMGLIFRMAGRDPLQLRKKVAQGSTSYLQPTPRDRTRDLKRQF